MIHKELVKFFICCDTKQSGDFVTAYKAAKTFEFIITLKSFKDTD